MNFNDPADHGEPHSGTGCGVELFEEAEELGLVPHIDTLSVVAYKKHNLAVDVSIPISTGDLADRPKTSPHYR